MPPFRPSTEVAVGAVRDALAYARERAGVAAVSRKGVRDVVTDADVAIEDAVRSLLHGALGVAVAGEERGGEPAEGPYWLVDPICGTRNFASGIPLYCVNLALIEDGAVTAAVVGDPATGDVLVAETGGGAWDVSGERPRRLAPDESTGIVVVEDSHAAGARREHAAAFAAAAVRADRWELRSLSTTLSLAWVASGRVAGYVLFWTSATHAAAGSLLAAEAGATVTDLAGEPWTVRSDALVAAAGAAAHADLIALLRSAAPGAG
ncbi:MAG TPA: inositol monophosphatase [Frankiaceae bacterium]|nr:inositol monophosphatase [Frankiaceae bacterium]